MGKINYKKRVENSPYNELIKETGFRLYQLRETEKLSMDEFVAKLGSEFRNGAVADISKSQYGRIEQGQCFMNIELLIAFCKFYNVSADYVLFGDNANGNVLVNLLEETDPRSICVFLKRLTSTITINFDTN